MRTQASQPPPGLAQRGLSPGQGQRGHSQVTARSPTACKALLMGCHSCLQPRGGRQARASRTAPSAATCLVSGRSDNLLDLAAV